MNAVILVWAVALSTQAGGEASPPSKWGVGSADGRCVIQRSFGGSDVTLEVSEGPTGDVQFQSIIAAKLDSGASAQTMILTLRPSGRVQTRPPPQTIVRFPNGRSRIIPTNPGRTSDGRIVRSFDGLDAEWLKSWSNERVLELSVGNASMLRMPLDGAASAIRAHSECVGKLVAALGIDQAEQAKVVKRAEAIRPESWLTAGDYPVDALSAEQEGTVDTLFYVETDGRVRDCRITKSSGSRALDTATCNLIRGRGRYTPAHDAQGQPVRQVASRRTVWSLPR